MPPFRIPDVVGDLAKDAVANHHPRATWLVVIEPDESRVAVFRVEIGPIARKNVGVEVDLHGWIEQSLARCQFKRRSFKLKNRPAERLIHLRTVLPAQAAGLFCRTSCRCAAHRRSKNRASPD